MVTSHDAYQMLRNISLGAPYPTRSRGAGARPTARFFPLNHHRNPGLLVALDGRNDSPTIYVAARPEFHVPMAPWIKVKPWDGAKRRGTVSFAAQLLEDISGKGATSILALRPRTREELQEVKKLLLGWRGQRWEIRSVDWTMEQEASDDEHDLIPVEEFLRDERDLVLREVDARHGQGAFRQAVLDAYSERCVISDWGPTAALDAAHIWPHRGPRTQDVRNGLLLRADIHHLFDLSLLWIEPNARLVQVDQTLSETEYAAYAGLPIRAPREREQLPFVGALASRHEVAIRKGRKPL